MTDLPPFSHPIMTLCDHQMLHEQSEARLKLLRQSLGNFDEEHRNGLGAGSVPTHLLGVDPVDFPDYENYDFEEESVYQNMIVTENKKLVPANSSQLEAQVWPRLPSRTICIDHIQWNFL